MENLNDMSASHMPPDFLMPWLFSVEQAVLTTFRGYSQLQDKEVEMTYEQFKEFFHQIARGKEMYEPSSGTAARQALIEAILEAIDVRESMDADEPYIDNPDIQPGGRTIHCLEALYEMGFGYLIRSARFWRKENGPKGYLRFLAEQMP